MHAHLEHGPCASFPANWGVRPAAVQSAQPRTLSAAEGHDLIVLMTHGKPGLSRFLEGSVAEDLVSDCPASVLVAR